MRKEIEGHIRGIGKEDIELPVVHNIAASSRERLRLRLRLILFRARKGIRYFTAHNIHGLYRDAGQWFRRSYHFSRAGRVRREVSWSIRSILSVG